MLGDLNKKFNNKKADAANNQLIVESVVEDEALLDEILDDEPDADSIPDEVYKKVDAALNGLIGEDLDDDEVEEMLDEEDLDDEEIDIALTGAAGAWYDDENIGHPDGNRRNGVKNQPAFKGGSMV